MRRSNVPRHSRIGRYGIFGRDAGHSALMPANLITLAHFSVSSAMIVPKASGGPASAIAPMSASCALIFVSARAALLEGQRTTAYDYATRAESGRAALQARWGDDNYRGYERRPDIQVRLKQLGQLLAAKK